VHESCLFVFDMNVCFHFCFLFQFAAVAAANIFLLLTGVILLVVAGQIFHDALVYVLENHDFLQFFKVNFQMHKNALSKHFSVPL